MDGPPAFVIGLMIGGVLTFMCFMMSGGLHVDHVRDYKACVEVGAPEQNCFDKFLIEKVGQ